MLVWLLTCLVNNTIYAQTQLIISSYATEQQEGIQLYQWNETNGTLTKLSGVRGIENPSFVGVHPYGKYIVAVSEVADDKQAAVVSYHLNQSTLEPINKSLVQGAHPCYISFSGDGKWIFTANYSSGNIAVHQFSDSIHSIQHSIASTGSSVHPTRQTKSHAHAVIQTPDQKYIWITNLGNDRIYVHRYDALNGISYKPEAVFECVAGSGPRHIAFHPSLPIAFVMEELTGTVSVIQYQGSALRQIQRLAITNNNTADAGSADIHVSPDGKFVYATNRGTSNSIVAMQFNSQTQQLGIIQTLPTGNGPRNFNISPSGRWVLVANQKSNDIYIYKRSLVSGLLQRQAIHTDSELQRPVCIQWVNRNVF
ncbi:MAG: lactonase family protein [Chitinophagaceae bacterium]